MSGNGEIVNRGSRPKAPDGGWGWMVVFGSFMVHIITDGVTYSFGIFYDEFLTYFNEGKGPTAWILSILVGVTLCSGPISSFMVNRWGCRVVTIIGSILASFCMMTSVFAQSVFFLYFTIGIGAGLGFGLIYLPAIVSVSMYFEERRSLATGIAVCGSGFGTFVFAPLITKLLEIFGWKGAMLIVSAVVMTCVIFGALFRPIKYHEEPVDEKWYPVKTAEAELNLGLTTSLGNFFLATSNGNVASMKRPWSSGELNSDQTNYGSILPAGPDFITSTKSEGTAHINSTRTQRHGIRNQHVLFQRSLLTIPAYRSNMYSGDDQNGYREKLNERKSSNFFSKALDSVHNTLDLSLFKDSAFILFILSNFLTSIGFNIPYVYIVSRAKSLGLSGEKAGLLLSIIGIANTIGRIVLGYLSDKTWVNRLYIYNTCLTLCGIATMLSCFCVDFYTLVVYGSVFGFTIGAYVGLTSVILVDLLGLDRLTNAFGLLLLFQGLASLIGPPIAGELYDNLKSYDPGFYVAGGTIALSGIILFFIPCVQRCKRKRTERALNNVYVF